MEELDAYDLRNCSNNRSNTDCHSDSSLYLKIAGTLIFIIIWPFIVKDFKFFPIGRPAAALLGGVLMVLFHVVNQNQAYRTEGAKDHLQTIFLLIGMMVISYYYDREGLLTILSKRVFGNNVSLKRLLWKVCVLSAVLSAFITNDAACLLVAPLVLKLCMKQRLRNEELLPLTLGIATSANIGGAATPFGNPQNVLIAARFNAKLYHFLIAEMPATILALLMNIGLLYLCFFKVIFRQPVEAPPQEETDDSDEDEHFSIVQSRSERSFDLDQSKNPLLTSQIAHEREITFSDNNVQIQLEKEPEDRMPMPTYRSTSTGSHVRFGGSTSHLTSSVQDTHQSSGTERLLNSLSQSRRLEASVNNTTPLKERPVSEKAFIVWLFVISALIIIILLIPPISKPVYLDFDLSLIPVAAAVLTMLVDSIVNRKPANDAITKVDWPVILMFMGIFVWIQGFQNTCIPDKLFDRLKTYMKLYKVPGVLLFTVFVLIASNIFSNVPLVLIISDRIDDLCESDNHHCKLVGGLLLAWIATIAGNLTLFGSIANLIVAEKAKKAANYELSFFRYLPYGVASTVIITFTTLPLVYSLGTGASMS